jgi:transcriptional regulator with XRE-family HTH domain
MSTPTATTNQDRMQWSTNLFEARIAAGLSQTALQDLSGVSQTQISRNESGVAPSYPNAVRLAAALDMEVTDLFPVEVAA